MRTLKRNHTLIKYATFKDKVEILDGNGYRTGQFTNRYNAKTDLRACVSAARGETQLDMFGVNANYTKTLVVDDVNCPIDENTILWVDNLSAEVHDYIVVQKAKSLNFISYAIRKVEVTQTPVFAEDENNVGEEP